VAIRAVAVQESFMPFEPASPESNYLNHAEDLALLLETLPHRLDVVDSVLAWRPAQRGPVLGRAVDHRTRFALDMLVRQLDRQAAAAQDAVREAVKAGKLDLLWTIASVTAKELRPVIAETRRAIAAKDAREDGDVPLARSA
jgi:hypothetical protein